jgi:D-Tyr-tRNAtyr deacylase
MKTFYFIALIGLLAITIGTQSV